MNKTCPKCGSMSIGDRGLLYYCGNKSTGVYETGKCIQIQRDQLLERNRELVENVRDRERERDHANATASAAIADNNKLLERMKRLEEAARVALAKAKEAKP